MNKRGLSDVVVTVLIILIVIVALGVIAAIVLPLLRDSGKQVGTEKFTTNVEIVPKFTAGSGECVLEFDINRPAGNGNITALRFVLTNTTGGTKTVDYPNAPTTPPFTFGQLEVKHIVLNCSPLNNVASVSVAPIFSNGVGIITDTRPVPTAVCGNGVVELGEQCDGGPGICNTGQGGLFLGRADCGTIGTPNQCKIVGTCTENKKCADGFDNNLNGVCDFARYSLVCQPSGGTSFGDSGCASAEDDDETPAEFNLAINEPQSSQTIGSIQIPAQIQLKITTSGLTAGQSINIASCNYTLDNSPTQIVIPGCATTSNGGIYTLQVGGLSVGQHTIKVVAKDSTGDLKEDSVSFNIVQSSLEIISPTSGQFISNPANIPLQFNLGTGFNPTGGCTYTISPQGVGVPVGNVQIPSCSSVTSTTFTLPQQKKVYSISVTAVQGTVPATLISATDFKRFRIDSCVGDIGRLDPSNPAITQVGLFDGIIDNIDLQIYLSQFGVCSYPLEQNPGQPAICGVNADFNSDNQLTVEDGYILISKFGTTC